MNRDGFKKIRIFLSSPGDVSAERECVKSVVEMLNQTGGIADKQKVVLEVMDWSSHVRPGMGRPQEVINQQLSVGQWDLFVGIIWVRFGTKSGGFNKETGEEFESGTEEEFTLAYTNWKETGRPNILFYRSNKVFTPLEIDLPQLELVHNFFNNFEQEGDNPGIYRVFDDESDFERNFTADLTSFLQSIDEEPQEELQEESEVIEEQETARDDEPKPGDRMVAELEAGKNHKIALLDIDVVGHSKLLKNYNEKDVGILLDNLQMFVLNRVNKFDGDQFTWAGDGGIFMFWGDEAFNNSVLTGIAITNELEVFNLSRKTNPLDEQVKIRMAGHCGFIEYCIPHSNIHADCINEVAHLEKYGTSPGCFNISDELYRLLEERLKETFKYIKNFKDYSLYTYKTSSTKLSEEHLENFVNNLKQNCANLNILLKEIKKAGGFESKMAALQEFVEKIYINLDSFYYQFFDYDERWSETYLGNLIRCINTVISEEETVYNEIQEIFASGSHMSISQDLVGLIQNAGVLRANSIPNLKRLTMQFEILLSSDKTPWETPKEYLYEKISAFIEADEFNEESALVEMLVCEKERVIEYIQLEDHDPMHKKLMQRLWKLADFLLIDDLAPPKIQMAKESRTIFPVAAQSIKGWNLFKIVLDIAKSFESIDCEKISAILKKRDVTHDKDDISVILRCLLIIASERNLRKEVVKSINFNDLWKLISYSRTPFTIIREITEHLYHLRDEDLMKIYFDLTLPRIIHEINNFSNEIILHQVKMVIIIFYNFNFFIETSYFERLEDLRLRFISESESHTDIRLNIIEEFMEKLGVKRKQRGELPASIPKGINKLPLPIQRHLAREGHYLDYFISHRHHLIALETLRYVNVNNIERLIRFLNRINSNLLRRILEKNELFKKNSVVFFILNSPKSTKQFAMKHSFKLNKGELVRIAQNMNANTSVRNYAKALIKNKFNIN